jgi:GTPase SAR1 family protein
MGICASEEDRKSKAVDEQIRISKIESDEVYKLLLLGPGESGKSTFFKQIVCSYGPGFSREYRIMAIPSIHNQILKTIKTLIEVADKTDQKIAEETERSKEVISRMDDSEVVTQEVAWHVGNLWNDVGIKAAYNLRFSLEHSFYLPDSTEYYFSQLHTISDPMYVPSNADLFRVRIPTAGILETEFAIKGVRFLLVDVGGQRNERRKWLNCFDGVKAVLFVVAISEYDQGLYEDSKVNRMVESIEVFNSIANEYFPDTSLIIFFNKMDKFKEKVRKVPVSRFFPSYTGQEGDADQVYAYFEKIFSELNQNQNRKVFFHPSCATETRSVKRIFDTVRDTVIRTQLKENALI